MSKSISFRRVSIIEDLHVILKVWEAQEVIYNACAKHESHLKIDSTYKEDLKSGFKWENIQLDIRYFYFNCQIWDTRISKPKKDIVKNIDNFAPKEWYEADIVHLSHYVSGDFINFFYNDRSFHKVWIDHSTKKNPDCLKNIS